MEGSNTDGDELGKEPKPKCDRRVSAGVVRSRICHY